MKEGFLIGGSILVLGLLLQITVGPVYWDLFAAPVNWIVLVLLLALIGTMFLLRRKVYAFICLQLCWWGINYLPSARGHSVHTY